MLSLPLKRPGIMWNGRIQYEMQSEVTDQSVMENIVEPLGVPVLQSICER